MFFSTLLHAYVAWRVAPDLPGDFAGVAFAALLVVSALLTPIALIARRVRDRRWADRLAWAGALTMGLFSSLFVLTLMRDALLLIAVPANWVAPAAVAALRLLPRSAMAVPLLGLAITLRGLINARRTAAVVEVDVPLAGLPAALHGFTIAQISDIHVGPTIKRPYLARIVAVVNRLEADMVAVTGDLVDGTVRELGQHVAPLAALRSTHGTFFVTGNHEYYVSGAAGASAWVDELRRLGLKVLMNEHAVLRHAGAAIVVAGITDFSAHHFDPAQRSDPFAALIGAPAGITTRVLLAHQPRSAEAAERAGFQLQLSGHTHGGQFLPWNWFVRFQQPFTAGLHRLRRLWVYTSRGTGYWGPPKRFGAPSEITRLRLVVAGP